MQSMGKVETTDTVNSALLVKFWQDSVRTVCNIQGGRLRFLEAVKEIPTVAGQEVYEISNNFRKLMTVLVWSEATTAGVPYTPEMVFDPVIWNRIKQLKLGTGTVPYYTYVENKTMSIQPIPSVSGNLIQQRGRLQTKDLTIADVTTLTVTSVPYTTTFTAALATAVTTGTLSGAWALPTGVYSVAFRSGTLITTPYTITLTGVVAIGATSATLSTNWTNATGVYSVLFSNGQTIKVTLTSGATTATWTTATTSASTAIVTIVSSSSESRLVTFTNGSTTALWATALTSSAISTITVSSATGGSIVTTTSGLTADMVGRSIRITQTSAVNGGDGFWYEIGAYYNATTMALTKPYEGTAITAGTAACVIGQVTVIPEAYDMAPIFRALALFTRINDPVNDKVSKNWWKLYDGGQEIGESVLVGGLIGQMLANEGETEEGSYVPPTGTNSPTQSGTPYYFPMTDASGF